MLFRSKWWELEHAFAWHIESLLRGALPDPGNELVDQMLDESIYTSALEYARGCDQDDLIRLVQAVKPELLEMVREEAV